MQENLFNEIGPLPSSSLSIKITRRNSQGSWSMKRRVLTLNAGSSSLKFALFDLLDTGPGEACFGQVEGLGGAATFSVRLPPGKGEPPFAPRRMALSSHLEALREVLDFIGGFGADGKIVAVGHRIVHGGAGFSGPALVDAAVLEKIRTLSPLAPLHQPHNIAGIEAARTVFPDALQVACFDTAFHRTHAWVDDAFGLPPEYYEAGVRRYGFHGLAYEHVLAELEKIAPEIAGGRIILAHLGNGASMCAVRQGRSVSSTMSFTPLDGLAMGTRCGQLDPGVVLYLLQERRMTLEAVSNLLHRGSGLKGMSGVSQDVRDIEAAGTEEARRAIDYFVHRARYEIGALTALLGGLDALVFSGGIGEHAAGIRARICDNFEWLGLVLDAERNRKSCLLTSAEASKVKAFIIGANEEITIARQTHGEWSAAGRSDRSKSHGRP
jgi:acetate kinase